MDDADGLVVQAPMFKAPELRRMLADRIIEWYVATDDLAAKDSFAARAIQWLVGQPDGVQAIILQRAIKPAAKAPRVAIAGLAMGLAIACLCFIAIQPAPEAVAAPALANAQGYSPELLTVYITRSGGKYHLPGCHYLGANKIPLPISEAVRHFEPCSICFPKSAEATAVAKGASTQPSRQPTPRKTGNKKLE